MEQADTNLISSLASDLNLDTAWELRAVTAFAKAAPEHRAYIRGHPHKSKQVDLLNELMRGAAAAGPAGAGSVAGAGARTVQAALNSQLPSLANDGDAVACSSSSSRPARHELPSFVHHWGATESGVPLPEAIRGYQESANVTYADFDPGTLPVLPARHDGGTQLSEAEVQAVIYAYMRPPLLRLGRHLMGGQLVQWTLQPTSLLLQHALAQYPRDKAPAADASTSAGKHASSSSSSSHLKVDFVVNCPTPEGGLRPLLVGEVKRPGVLQQWAAGFQLADEASTQPGPPQAVVAQLFTYLRLWQLQYGFISTYSRTWLVHRPPETRPGQGGVYVSEAFAAEAAGPAAATALGALAWLQHAAIGGAAVAAAGPTAGAAMHAGAGGGGGEDGGGLPAGQQQPQLQPSGHAHGSTGSGGAASSSVPSDSSGDMDYTPSTCRLECRELLQESQERASSVYRGTYQGRSAIIKLLGPHGAGVREWRREVSAYQRMGSLQGGLVPRLLGAGQLSAGVHYLALEELQGGVTLRQLLHDAPQPPAGSASGGGGSTSGAAGAGAGAGYCGNVSLPGPVATAAMQALAHLHAACPGLLHGDIRLANIMLLPPGQQPPPPAGGGGPRPAALAGPPASPDEMPAASGSGAPPAAQPPPREAPAAAPPRVVIVDFGRARAQGASTEEQAAEREQLRQVLQTLRR